MRRANAELELPLMFDRPQAGPMPRPDALADELLRFEGFGKRTRELSTPATDLEGTPIEVPTYVNEFWTASQRQANRLHEVSYRACFKPHLPRFFIERLTRPGDVVHDPFMGRGTTPIEAALLGRIPYGCDVNPLSVILTQPRLRPPDLSDVAERLASIDLRDAGECPADLLVFYHPETLQEISALRKYLLRRHESGRIDLVDAWIRMVAVNRLTGHSGGFFSVYTLPPNQAVSVKSQRRINERRRQVPPRRDVRAIILKKSRQLLGQCPPEIRQRLQETAQDAKLLTTTANDTPDIPPHSVRLVVTSPPFLNVVAYATDNWLRGWFAGIDPDSVRLTVSASMKQWRAAMTEVFREQRRILVSGGHVAFEVGEVRRGRTRLEEEVIPCALAADLEPILVMIHDQAFTKTAHCWGVDNNSKGTNTNRIVLLRKP
jgi:hypothetical protein